MAAISFQNVVKRYGTAKSFVQVIHNLSATVEHGEFVVIVGPSGCGKSTLLRMVAGLEEITAGTISIGARVVNDLEPAERLGAVAGAGRGLDQPEAVLAVDDQRQGREGRANGARDARSAHFAGTGGAGGGIGVH